MNLLPGRRYKDSYNLIGNGWKSITKFQLYIFDGGIIMAKVVAIVQARMGSARLPGKVAMEIEGKPMLAHLIDRLKYAQKLDQIIIATSNKETDDSIAHISEANGVVSYRGSENDVLSRYLEAGEKYHADIIVRITGDCPLIDPGTVDELIQTYLDSKLDYMRLNVGEDGYPRGLDAEIFSYKTLKKVDELLHEEEESNLTSYREHVTLYIYRHPEQFTIGHHNPPADLKRNYRLCVDEIVDLELINEIYKSFYITGQIIDIKKVIKALDDDFALAGMNKNVEQKKA